MRIPSDVETVYVDGRWWSASGTKVDAIDPTTGEVLASLPSATTQEVHEALLSAQRAQRNWAHTPSVVRGELLRQVADVLDANSDELALLIVADVGKPLSQAKTEVGFATQFLRYSAEWDRRLEGEILPADVPGEVIHLHHSPIGVVGAICPWNFPLAVLCRKIGPALVTGNTVVVKPSEVSPLSTIRLFQLIDEGVDLPAGVLNLVTGAATTGRALVEDPVTNMVSFTGHRDTGKEIMALAATNLTRVALELGGKAPAIVCHDADLGVAVPAILAARHTNSGQVCTSAERVFVDGRVYDEFLDAYVRAVKGIRLGIPTDPVDMGPLASAAQVAKVEGAVARALDEGAEMVYGGGRPSEPELARGCFYLPTVLAGVQPTMAVMQEETFGPVTPVAPVTSLEEAIQLSNDSRYGLSAYVFSRDYETVMRLSDELEFGEIYVNRTLGESVHAHHAGYRESGMGGEDGKWGLLRFTQVKTVYHHYESA